VSLGGGRQLFDLELDGLGDGLAGGVLDGQGVVGGLFGGKREAAGVGRPDFACRGIESDGLGVGHVVAKLGRLATFDGGGGNVHGANGEVRATELFDGAAVVFATLLGLFFGVAFDVLAIGFVAGKQDVGDVSGDDEKDDRGIDQRIFEDGFFFRVWRRLRIEVHASPPVLSLAARSSTWESAGLAALI
jgi:hypothetical protein